MIEEYLRLWETHQTHVSKGFTVYLFRPYVDESRVTCLQSIRALIYTFYSPLKKIVNTRHSLICGR